MVPGALVQLQSRNKVVIFLDGQSNMEGTYPSSILG